MPVSPKQILTVALSLSVLAIALAIVTQDRLARAETQDDTEEIDLTSWRDQKGRTLAEVNKGNTLALVVLVNPSCTTCFNATNSLLALRERAQKSGMAYYVLMIPDGTTATEKYFSYADSLKIDAEAFVWSNPDAKPPASLTTMPVPSHVLLNSELPSHAAPTTKARIINKWTGVPEKTSTP